MAPFIQAMPTIGRLLGQQGRGSYMNQPYGTSTMRATMADDFANMTSNVGRPSSSNSESFGYADMDSNGECQNDEPIDKHCVHWTEGET
ncbi:hypothetical protein SESBI_02922 [Sesbania bispinosa]|nr:hypothetical protein SESBI_02922 [Sesbania bispinosa]